MWLGKLSSNLQYEIVSVLKELKYLVRFRSDILVFKRVSDYGWGQALFKFLILSKDISIYWENFVWLTIVVIYQWYKKSK